MSEGLRVARLFEDHLRHPEGEYWGAPIKLMDWQRELLVDLYARPYDVALIGMPKGNAKSTLAAGIGDYELLASKRPGSPDVPVAAASFEQANLVFGSAATMLAESDLADMVDAQDTQILVKGKPGRMYRVAAQAGSNDGRRPSVVIKDEFHEWVGPQKERVSLVLDNGLPKRRRTLGLHITTAGVAGTDTPCERLYRVGQSGKSPRMFHRWWTASEHHDLTTDAGLMAAVLEANPAAGPGGWLDPEAICRRFYEVAEGEFRRYYLNQWTASSVAWLPLGTWDALANPKGWPEAGAEVVLGFDGSYNRDSTALVGCTLDGYVFVVKVWERPPLDPSWQVPRYEVMDAIHASMKRWRVVELAYDPPGWHREFEELEADYGEAVVVQFPTNTRQRAAEAASRFYTAVVVGDLHHDGSEVLARHLRQCTTKPTPYGTVIVKEHKDSERKIDAAVAAIVAHDRATHRREAVYTGSIFLG